MRKHGIFGAAALCALLLWGVFCPPAGAAVLSTPEAAGGADSIYVAGNPDWYPIEYYDPDTGCYEGVLPELLERVGEKTGLNFTYIRAGEEDQRLRLARNGQVELVSGCASDDPVLWEDGVTAGGVILTVPQEDGELEACFAYTKIAGDGLAAAVEGALGELSRQEAAGIAVSLLIERSERMYPAWRVPAGAAALLLLLALIAVLSVWLRSYQKAAGQDQRFDPVTGIGNKAYFTERFEKSIPDQYRGLYCVVFIGFDIARVNQYYGEMEAEEQLHFAANELLLSTADNEIAARVSGGGFAVARPSSGEQEAGAWTEKLLERLNRYTEKYGKGYRPDFHAGIYMLQPSDRDCETVLFNVRQGYQRAIAGNTAMAFSRPELLRQESEKRELKKQTLGAVQNREFRMFLQFVVRGKDGQIVSAEALSRWDHPQKGLLYPGSYIELMESENTITELDFYIFEEACRQLEHWQKQGRRLSISCNFTRITIDHENFIPQLKRIADRYFFERSGLVIEITEDTMENNKEAAFANVSRCRALGFRIALDDTGSGYTSFSDLRDYPIDIVKIDRSILNAAVNDRGIALLKGMIALAHGLQMEVLCEGVETAAQADLLRRLECDYLQGYYFYRALPKEEADRLLDTRDRHAEA